MAKAEEFHVVVKGPGLELDRKVDGNVARAVISLIFGVSTPMPTGPTPIAPRGPNPAIQPLAPSAVAQPTPSPARQQSTPKLSIAEFLKEHEAARNVDKIACIAAFLKEQRDQQTFTRENIESLFEDAREKVPGNLSRDLTWTAKVGWIAPSSQNENEFYLTRTGQDAVEKHFPAEVKQKTKIGGRPPKKGKAKSAKRGSG